VKIDYEKCDGQTKALAQKLYETYNENSGWLSWNGGACPSWEVLGESYAGRKVRSHWAAVAYSVSVGPSRAAIVVEQMFAQHCECRSDSANFLTVPGVDMCRTRHSHDCDTGITDMLRDIYMNLGPLVRVEEV
jgi:hypothetical protein